MVSVLQYQFRWGEIRDIWWFIYIFLKLPPIFWFSDYPDWIQLTFGLPDLVNLNNHRPPSMLSSITNNQNRRSKFNRQTLIECHSNNKIFTDSRPIDRFHISVEVKYSISSGLLADIFTQSRSKVNYYFTFRCVFLIGNLIETAGNLLTLHWINYFILSRH